jgi:hypothetical protein
MAIVQKPDNRPKVPRTGGVPVEPKDPTKYKEKENRATRFNPYDDPSDPTKAPE